MHNNPGSWMNTLAKCNLLRYSTVKESGDGHVSITINALTDIKPEPFNKQSKEAASEILSLYEISSIWLTDNYGITLTSRYDGCTITINDLDFDTFREENLDKEFVRLDNELGEISWTGIPQIGLYDFLQEVTGSDLAKVFLRNCSTEVYLRRFYDLGECQRRLPWIYRMIKKSDYGLWGLWDNSNPVWAIVPRKG